MFVIGKVFQSLFYCLIIYDESSVKSTKQEKKGKTAQGRQKVKRESFSPPFDPAAKEMSLHVKRVEACCMLSRNS
jgi:hypothetical protein